ncbi:hypothetical protein OfM2_17550 [Lactovum odontotermitis]
MKKMWWTMLLFLDIALFSLSLISGQVLFNIPVIILAFFIHRFGNPVLFEDYYNRKRKIEQRRKFNVHKRGEDALPK